MQANFVEERDLFMYINEYLSKQSKPFFITSGLILVLFVGTVDYVTGEELSISIFYLLPISLITWFVNRRIGILISAVSAAVWYIADFMVGHIYSHPLIPYWNSIVLLGFFFVTVFIMSALKTEYEKRKNLIVELKDAIAKLKYSENELKQTAQDLANSNVELERFAYVAAHDLKGPLLVVEGYINRLHRRYKDKLDSDADSLIGNAIDGITRMRKLINDLLTYARVGTKTKDFEPINCNDIIKHTVTTLQTDIEKSGAIVTHDELPTILADDIQIDQLLQNLLGNSIKFRREEPPHVHISAEQKENKWIFSVCDNGIGIAPEDVDRIFEIFHRLHNTAEYPGTGIGLAICKKIVERHGGRIWVESERGKGSTFYFTIPIKKRV